MHTGIAAPPMQIIAKDLTEVWADCQEPEKMDEEELAKENLDLSSEHMPHLMNAAVKDAVAAALKSSLKFSAISSTLLAASGRVYKKCRRS